MSQTSVFPRHWNVHEPSVPRPAASSPWLSPSSSSISPSPLSTPNLIFTATRQPLMHSQYETPAGLWPANQAWEQFGGGGRGWTQDHHVTSPMSPPAPSDPTTLSLSSQQITCAGPPHPPVPQQPACNTATLVPVWPPPPLHAPTPQLATSGPLPGRIPRPAPREHGLQDDLYYAFTRDAYLCSATEAARDVTQSWNPNAGYHCLVAPTALPAATTATAITHPKETVKKPHRRPQHPLKRLNHALPSHTPPPTKKPKSSLSPDDLHFVDSSFLATINAAMMEIASRQLPPHQAMASPSPKISFKDTTWTFPKKLRKKRRRPSEIFNINFGFGFSSRRRQSSDYSPQISPRTSISSASGSPRSEMAESFKRQRIDSTDSDIINWQSVPKQEPLTTTRCQPQEPHPGQLVDFTRSPPSLPPLPAPVSAPVIQLPSPRMSPKLSPRLSPESNPSSEFNLRLNSDAYHEYLATTQRRKSFPVSEWATRRVQEEFQMLSKLDQLDDGITKDDDEIDPKDISAIAPFASSSPATEQDSPKCELRRTTSDPSTERFLTHIRASLEARRSKSGRTWQTYPVFADEDEKGFLDDAPL
ncbi:hypothetical protein yc1106_00616 [Curvularia clavata]|uniref:Uncharacterized protein n=1 Tax=Curvularia clavata TaxID=95742 RepID=A0A9Q9DNG0_CURCL|nr:hypothetical protein yc1106_00616 [Curvularia clavata]